MSEPLADRLASTTHPARVSILGVIAWTGAYLFVLYRTAISFFVLYAPKWYFYVTPSVAVFLVAALLGIAYWRRSRTGLVAAYVCTGVTVALIIALTVATGGSLLRERWLLCPAVVQFALLLAGRHAILRRHVEADVERIGSDRPTVTRESLLRIASAPLLVGVAVVLSGLYGSVHNQISYTVSPEYFTQFKFLQFRIAEGTPKRLGAAIVGWKAAAGMGGLVALFVVPAALRQPGLKPVWVNSLRGFAVAIGVTLVVGLVALAVGFVVHTSESVGEVSRYGHSIDDDVAFWRVGTMHNFSYAGGVVGTIVACIVTVRLPANREPRPHADLTPKADPSAPAVRAAEGPQQANET